MSIFTFFRRHVAFPRTAPLIVVLLMIFSNAYPGGAESKEQSTLRCGWFDNPTPSNAWLHDRHGEWEISVQGEYQAKGEWPRFKGSQWVRTGSGSSGYGCACMNVQANAQSQRVTRIISAQAKPLAACRRDKALKEPENPLGWLPEHPHIDATSLVNSAFRKPH